MEVPVRDGDLLGHAEGRVARASKGGRRSVGAAHHGPAVARSRHDEGNHADAIPIPIATELVPYLRAAIDASPSELVFPRPDGRMMSRQVQLGPAPERPYHPAQIGDPYPARF